MVADLSSYFTVSDLPSEVIGLDDGRELICRPLKLEDYEAVRNMMPHVSRCSEFYTKEVVSKMLQLDTFFPFVLELLENKSLIGYAEIHRLPHLGRGFDGRLEKVLVLEEFRGNKLAQKACTFLAQVAKTHLACGRIDLTVEKPDARKVYNNLGFAKVDTEVMRIML